MVILLSNVSAAPSSGRIAKSLGMPDPWAFRCHRCPGYFVEIEGSRSAPERGGEWHKIGRDALLRVNEPPFGHHCRTVGWWPSAGAGHYEHLFPYPASIAARLRWLHEPSSRRCPGDSCLKHRKVDALPTSANKKACPVSGTGLRSAMEVAKEPLLKSF